MADYETEVAKCEGFDIGSDDHGGLALRGTFHYEGGTQGLGYRVDIDFVQRFMEVFRVEALRQVNGRYCKVTHNDCKVIKVAPLLSTDGKVFDITEWTAEKQAALKRAQ